MIHRTPLYSAHVALNAKMVDFHGWFMPLHYGSQIEEHHAVRNDAGAFDVSHMNVVDILGVGGRSFLRYLLANDIDKLQPGKALYSCMLNESGGVIDDLIVYQRAPDRYRLVLNSATKEKDLAWIEKQSKGFSIGVQIRSDLAIVAVQGPNAIQKTLPLLSDHLMDKASTLGNFETAEEENYFIARTGYTGEDGFEIILPKEAVEAFWQKLMAAGVQPCGLGARDTLRLEAGLNLYGQDMTENTSPLESNLAWTIAWDPADRDFIGRTSLETQKRNHIKQKLIGLVLEEKGVLRAHQKVITPFGEGEITSGTFSPTLGCSIALARVPIDTKQSAQVEIRNQLLNVKIVQPRFVKFGKNIIKEIS